MEREAEPLRELFFVARGFYHDLYNPAKDPKLTYPASYDALRQGTHMIQEERTLRKAAQSAKKVRLKPIP